MKMKYLLVPIFALLLIQLALAENITLNEGECKELTYYLQNNTINETVYYLINKTICSAECKDVDVQINISCPELDFSKLPAQECTNSCPEIPSCPASNLTCPQPQECPDTMDFGWKTTLLIFIVLLLLIASAFFKKWYFDCKEKEDKEKPLEQKPLEKKKEPKPLEPKKESKEEKIKKQIEDARKKEHQKVEELKSIEKEKLEKARREFNPKKASLDKALKDRVIDQATYQSNLQKLEKERGF